MISALPFLLAAAAVQGGDAAPASSGARATILVSATIISSQRITFTDALKQDGRQHANDRQITEKQVSKNHKVATVEFY